MTQKIRVSLTSTRAMTWCRCCGNLLLFQSQQNAGHLKTTHRTSMLTCNQNGSQAHRQQIVKCPSLVLGLCHPFWKRDVKTLGEPTGCPPPCNSRSPWLTSQTSPRLPLCGLMFELWLIRTQTQGDRPTVSKQRRQGWQRASEGSAGTAEERWRIRGEKQSEVRTSHVHRCFDYSPNHWQLFSLTCSVTLYDPTLSLWGLALGVQVSHHDCVLIRGQKTALTCCNRSVRRKDNPRRWVTEEEIRGGGGGGWWESSVCV